jgi:hypothetical protein
MVHALACQAIACTCKTCLSASTFHFRDDTCTQGTAVDASESLCDPSTSHALSVSSAVVGEGHYSEFVHLRRVTGH